MHLTILYMGLRKFFNIKTLAFALIIAGGYYFITHNPFTQAPIPNSPSINSSALWWNTDYAYRQQINTDSSETQVVVLNHAQMVIDGKANSDGSDIKVMAQKDDIYRDVDIKISGPDEVGTKIKFEKLSNAELKYYLYYGNKNPQTEKVLGTDTIIDDSNTTLSREESPIVALINFKRWVLKEDSTDLSFRVETKEDVSEETKIFAIVNNFEGVKFNATYKDGSIKIPTDNIKSGVTKVYAVFEINGQTYRTNTVTFNYSLPLYVTWTIDWEGTIPDSKYLDAMEGISDTYSIPMTQYFNPRIYSTRRFTDVQRKSTTDWLKKRYQLGDDIGMHMHMHHDMVEEVGIKAKYTAPTWDNGISGYDTPSTAYTYDEYLKMLNWGKTELKTQIKRYSGFDIPELQGFRAGGWFANLENLKAIQDAGFIYDTSGRVAFPIGGNKMAQPWNLQTTTQPYKISSINQNINTAPTLNLMELPNNGLDSYWSTDKELIANFYQNYNPGEILDRDKLITFLSHPDWFYIDEPKLKNLFTEINKYTSETDKGPVKFVTMREYLEKSEHIKDIRK